MISASSSNPAKAHEIRASFHLKKCVGHSNVLGVVDELEDHMDDLLDEGELEARMMNTIGAAKLVAPAVWKASREICAEFLGKL